ncbi:unnamed protein product [Rotaria sp. Silwood1]|nr:unnamed protein product [Rotaria sp. Silwood1]
MKSRLIKATPSSIDHHSSIDKTINLKIRATLNNAQSESGEKYFNWVRKTQRPMEFLRGKRHWFFAKEAKNDKNADLMPNMKARKSLLIQRLWGPAPARQRLSLVKN